MTFPGYSFSAFDILRREKKAAEIGRQLLKDRPDPECLSLSSTASEAFFF
jgi:hypothetical protein